jgi:hypothetical protein
VLESIAHLQQGLWALNAATSVFLLFLLAYRENYRIYPVFTFYIFANLALGALAFVIYHRWGFSSLASWRVGWTMVILAVCARALAVIEICKHFLSPYPGIWVLARRIFLVLAAFVLLYSGLAAKHQLRLVPPNADRGLELSLATVIVALLFFVHHYDLPANAANRSLAVGFCLYSCFRALNNTILEVYLHGYAPFWNALEMLAFLASLFIWAWALRKTQRRTRPEEALLPARIYEAVVPQINDRLRLLNDHLGHVLRAGKAEEDKS